MTIDENIGASIEESTDTRGFYKLDGDLLHAPNFVLNADYMLYRETHADRAYPVDGWYWFDSEAEATAFFMDKLNGSV